MHSYMCICIYSVNIVLLVVLKVDKNINGLFVLEAKCCPNNGSNFIMCFMTHMAYA